MKVIIDRFEGDFAVVELENRQMADMPKALLPPGAREGDVISIIIDKTATAERKKKIEGLMSDLWAD